MANVIRMGTLVRALASLKTIEAMTKGSTDPKLSAIYDQAMPSRCEIEAFLNVCDSVEIVPNPPASAPCSST